MDIKVNSKISRPEKVYTATGRIEEYKVGDTLYVGLGAKKVLRGEFYSHGQWLQFWDSTDLSKPLTFDIKNAGQPAPIDYMIVYVRGGDIEELKITIQST